MHVCMTNKVGRRKISKINKRQARFSTSLGKDEHLSGLKDTPRKRKLKFSFRRVVNKFWSIPRCEPRFSTSLEALYDFEYI